jgi:hypothetical protein
LFRTHALAPILALVSVKRFKPNVREAGGREGGEDLGYWVGKIMGRDDRSEINLDRIAK